MKKKIKILIIDDDATIRSALAQILKEEKYDTTTKDTGKSALAALQKENFNIAIIDLKLPDTDGVSLLEKIKKKIPDICTIVITAFPEITTAIDAIKKQAYGYIIKPFDIEQIKMTIKRCIEKQTMEKENKKLLETLSDEKEKLEKVLIISKKISLMHNVKKIARFLIINTCEMLKAERGSLMLLEDDTLKIIASKGLDKKIVKTTSINMGKEVAGWVAKHGHPLLVKDVENDIRTKHAGKGNYKSRSFLSMPLKVKSKIIGVINLTDKNNKDTIFKNGDLKFLSVIINQGSVVIENAKLYERLNHEAITDSVTKIFNHRYFKIQITKEIERAERYSILLSLIMVDIDNFKIYNDSYGHLHGDMTLKITADILKNNLRKSDVICRYGGDEFIIILPYTNILSALRVSEKLRKAVEKYNFNKKKKEKKTHLTLSLGASTYKKGYSIEKLISKADQALYMSKKSGGNTSSSDQNHKKK